MVVHALARVEPNPSEAGAPTAEPPAFADVFREQARFVWRALLGLGVDPVDVQDASQQVFVVLHRKLPSFDATSTLRTFVYGICLRVASEYRRRAHRRYEKALADVPEGATPPTQENDVARREVLERFEAALGQLKPVMREVFVLYEIEELSMVEVAQVTQCPVPTAYSRLRAARRELLALLGESWMLDETSRIVGRCT